MMESLSWVSDCSSIHSIWKFAGNVFMLTENGVANIQRSDGFFWCSSSLFSNREHGYVLFAVHRTAFSQCIKMHTIICQNTVLLLPHVPVSAKAVPIAQQYLAVVSDGCSEPGLTLSPVWIERRNIRCAISTGAKLHVRVYRYSLKHIAHFIFAVCTW